MIEAMARGLCSLGSRVGGIPELAPEDALFAPGDPTSMLRCIENLLLSPQRATEIARWQWDLAKTICADTDPSRYANFLLDLRASSR